MALARSTLAKVRAMATGCQLCCPPLVWRLECQLPASPLARSSRAARAQIRSASFWRSVSRARSAGRSPPGGRAAIAVVLAHKPQLSRVSPAALFPTSCAVRPARTWRAASRASLSSRGSPYRAGRPRALGHADVMQTAETRPGDATRKFVTLFNSCQNGYTTLFAARSTFLRAAPSPLSPSTSCSASCRASPSAPSSDRDSGRDRPASAASRLLSTSARL